MGAKYSHVAQTIRRLQFASAKRAKSSNAAAQAGIAADLVAAIARVPTPQQLLEALDLDEASIMHTWEVIRFLRRETAEMQAALLRHHHPQVCGARGVGSPLTDSQLLQMTDLLAKIKQIWMRLDTPPTLPRAASAPTAIVAAVSPIAARAGTPAAGSGAVHPASPLSSPASPLRGAVTPLSLESMRDPSVQLTRDEVVGLFRDLSNQEIDLLLASSLARAALLHPKLPSTSPLHTRPSATQTRFKDIFRWLFDILDSDRQGTLTGLQIREWLVGPRPGVGGRSTRNEMLAPIAAPRIAAQTRIITNKLQGARRYTKPEFEYMFCRWSYDDLVSVSRECRLGAEFEAASFQGEVRTFHALTRRVDTLSRASARFGERAAERRTSGVSGETIQLSADIAALLTEKDRRAAEDAERERREQARAAEIKRREERESRELDERRRRALVDAELRRAEDRALVAARDAARDSARTDEDLQAYAIGMRALWARNEGRLPPQEMEAMFRLQETHRISRRVAVEVLARIDIPVERVHVQMLATIPDLEPMCIGCLLHSSTHMTRECGHMFLCDRCAAEAMARPPHVRSCRVCARAFSQLIRCVYQHWTK